MRGDRQHFPPHDQPEEPEGEDNEPTTFWKIIGVICLSPFLVMAVLIVVWLFKICWRLAFG